MAGRDPSVDDLARKMTRRNALMRVPPQPTVTLRQAVVTKVNVGGSQCHIKLGGSDTEIPGVTFMHPYQPKIGHTCWVLVNGPDALVIGQHVANAPVTP